MEKTKFTPGPWKPLFVSGICVGIGTDSEYGYSKVIMNTILPESDLEYEEQKCVIEANAKVIAAAPELYEALEALVNIPSSNMEHQDLRAKAIAALNKAS